MPKIKESVPHNVIHLTANKTLKYIYYVCVYINFNLKHKIYYSFKTISCCRYGFGVHTHNI